MKTNIIILTFLVLISFGWVYYSANQQPQFNDQRKSKTPQNEALTTAADFTYTTIKGHTGTASNHKDKVILLHFWASWCAPCIVEFPDLIDLANTQNGNLIVLAISTDENRADIQKFLKKLNKPVPNNMILAQDPKKEISQDLYQTIKLPETYLITPNFQIFEKIIGPQDNWNDSNWHNKIETLAHH